MLKKLFALSILSTNLAFAVGDDVSFTVESRYGRGLAEYSHAGLHWIAGTVGDPYQLVIQNNTGIRKLAIVSVDGLNVLTGDEASPQQSGYVVPAYGRVVVPGWRKTTQEVAQFYFSSPGDAYADKTGRPANKGVLGVALFNEKQRPVMYPTPMYQQRGSAEAKAMNDLAGSAPAPASAPMMEKSIGTGHGQREHNPVTMTEFKRASSEPYQVLQIRYDTHQNLVRKGIIVEEKSPNPFPGKMKFVPDP